MKAYLQCRYGAPHPKRNYDGGHEHRSSQAAIRCAKHIVNHDPDGWNVRIYLVIDDDGVIIDETAVGDATYFDEEKYTATAVGSK